MAAFALARTAGESVLITIPSRTLVEQASLNGGLSLNKQTKSERKSPEGKHMRQEIIGSSCIPDTLHNTDFTLPCGLKARMMTKGRNINTIRNSC